MEPNEERQGNDKKAERLSEKEGAKTTTFARGDC